MTVDWHVRRRADASAAARLALVARTGTARPTEEERSWELGEARSADRGDRVRADRARIHHRRRDARLRREPDRGARLLRRQRGLPARGIDTARLRRRCSWPSSRATLRVRLRRPGALRRVPLLSFVGGVRAGARDAVFAGFTFTLADAGDALDPCRGAGAQRAQRRLLLPRGVRNRAVHGSAPGSRSFAARPAAMARLGRDRDRRRRRVLLRRVLGVPRRGSGWSSRESCCDDAHRARSRAPAPPRPRRRGHSREHSPTEALERPGPRPCAGRGARRRPAATTSPAAAANASRTWNGSPAIRLRPDSRIAVAGLIVGRGRDPALDQVARARRPAPSSGS